MGISIIIPVYNMAASLEKCVLSVASCNSRDLQIVLVDDGSQDESLSICHKLADSDDRIVVIHQTNQGSGPARNAGIGVASEDYFLFMDADDFFEQAAIDSLLDLVSSSESDLFVFGYHVISPTGKTATKSFQKREFSGNEVRTNYTPFFNNQFKWAIQGAPWNKLFKASIIRENGIVFPPLRRHQDEVFISRFVDRASTIEFSERILYSHYANDAKLIWRKYPDNYFEVMSGLYEYRREIIENWNPKNEAIKALTYSEYVNNSFRACFKLFDNARYSRYNIRKAFYQNIHSDFIYKNVKYPHEYVRRIKRLQNRLFVFFLSKNCYFLLDCLIRIRLEAFKRS